MRMRSGARRGAAALAHKWPEPVMGWMRAQGIQARLWHDGGNSDGRKKRASVVNPDPCKSICSGVHRVVPLWLPPPYDVHHNGSILII
jgi:hypothetical protein